jgi:deoxyribose-phosphate aldolase
MFSQLIDLTLLDLNSDTSDIQKLADQAMSAGVAGVCIYPKQLNWLPDNFNLRKAIVANFPTGQEPVSDTLTLIEKFTGNIDELDYVFKNLSELKQVSDLCQQAKIRLKVILETGMLSDIECIYKLSMDVIQTGCDFLKTSSGKTLIGATLPAAQAMLLAIKNSQLTCGIKVSGGIRTVKTAKEYVRLAEDMLAKSVDAHWFRIGASQLLTN